MKIARLSAAAAFFNASAVIASGTTPTSEAATTTTSVAPSCTASLITTLCDYKDPGPEFAVAEDSRESCWAYCNKNQPCDFVIFADSGNPYNDYGTCWLYPGETFDESAGDSSSCGNPYIFVYSKPECAGPSSTPTSGACAATASPSAIASVCGYPTPPDDCWSTCTASGGATDCLSQCAEADSCNYAVFNPHNPSGSPYADGTCWMYPNGTYDAGAAGTCSGKPEQFVYTNPCPKPSPPPSSSSSSSSASPSATGSTNGDKAGSAAQDATLEKTSPNTAPFGSSLSPFLAVGTIVLLLVGLS
jgi:hypothetical protein